MKILLTGGGTGGHFYPIVAVAQAIRKLEKENKLVDVELYYMAPQPYDKQILFDLRVNFIKGTSGKLRRYFSLMNVVDTFKTFWGVLRALWSVYSLYPDVIFGKGGSVSFPALFAAKFFRIPVVIHESDSAPGRVNIWAGKFARRVAISYPQAADSFPKDRVAYTGNPVRLELLVPIKDGAHEFLSLEKNIPTILILGGSQGAQIINENIVDALPRLLEKYNVIHQTGRDNINYVMEISRVVLEKSQHADRYKAFDNLDALALRMAAGASDLVVSRAGSTIFEIAIWELPSILIPITDSNGDHQRKNAYSYARTGAAIVVEENNLTPNIIVSEIQRILTDTTALERMKAAARAFARADSSEVIAQEILTIGLEHER